MSDLLICDDCWCMGATLGREWDGFTHGTCDECGYPSSQLSVYRPEVSA